jgi:hypothetical protein
VVRKNSLRHARLLGVSQLTSNILNTPPRHSSIVADSEEAQHGAPWEGGNMGTGLAARAIPDSTLSGSAVRANYADHPGSRRDVGAHRVAP